MARDKLPTLDSLIANILNEYAGASWADKTDGINWYPIASSHCHTLAQRYGITRRQAALVVAALSPQIGWNRNLELADLLLSTGSAPHFTACQAKALECLTWRTSLTNGNNALKTQYFADLLTNPNADRVVIDGHAASIALGHRLTKADSDKLTRNSRGYYKLFETAYRQAAEFLELKPSTLQAITWLAYRHRTGIENLVGR